MFFIYIFSFLRLQLSPSLLSKVIWSQDVLIYYKVSWKPAFYLITYMPVSTVVQCSKLFRSFTHILTEILFSLEREAKCSHSVFFRKHLEKDLDGWLIATQKISNWKYIHNILYPIHVGSFMCCLNFWTTHFAMQVCIKPSLHRWKLLSM